MWTTAPWVVMALLIVGCGSRPTPVPSTERTVTWTWEPGSCTKAYRLYEVMADTNTREVATVVVPRYVQRMTPRKSAWMVSGVCDDDTQYFSDVVELQSGS